MDTLVEDFNEFAARRLYCVGNHTPIPQTNEAADCLKQTLNQEQSELLIRALDFEHYSGAILEENAYRQAYLTVSDLHSR